MIEAMDATFPPPHADPLRLRLAALVDALECGLVERGREVRLALLAALAGEHTLLIGPPGTAKSELARRIHRAFRGGRYFERLLTRFSVPEELFGPLSIAALEQDRYERQTAGFLPEASIAFIDEVFKANSAILNALLTLLNEREFDNGAVRQRCPLISVIGATNEVPEDEVAEAFFDRFLVRLPVVPVSVEGFRRLLGGAGAAPRGEVHGLDAGELHDITEAARCVTLSEPFAELLVDLRAWSAAEGVYVSDRCWVKVANLLKVAAATEGRQEVVVWDAWLLPWCVAPDAARAAAVDGWLCARLGVAPPLEPERLKRAVEAFEALLEAEQNANELDYDENGRLKFRDDLAAEVGDPKGASKAARLTYSRQRRYGACHIGARLAQLDELLGRLALCAAEVDARRADLAAYAGGSLWLDHAFAERALAHLAGTAAHLAALRERALRARAGFEGLPRLAVDSGAVPEPLTLELEDVPS